MMFLLNYHHDVVDICCLVGNKREASPCGHVLPHHFYAPCRNAPNAMSPLKRTEAAITWSVGTRIVKQSFAGCVLALGSLMVLPGKFKLCFLVFPHVSDYIVLFLCIRFCDRSTAAESSSEQRCMKELCFLPYYF